MSLCNNSLKKAYHIAVFTNIDLNAVLSKIPKGWRWCIYLGRNNDTMSNAIRDWEHLWTYLCKRNDPCLSRHSCKQRKLITSITTLSLHGSINSLTHSHTHTHSLSHTLTLSPTHTHSLSLSHTHMTYKLDLPVVNLEERDCEDDITDNIARSV